MVEITVLMKGRRQQRPRVKLKQLTCTSSLNCKHMEILQAEFEHCSSDCTVVLTKSKQSQHMQNHIGQYLGVTHIPVRHVTYEARAQSNYSISALFPN